MRRSIDLNPKYFDGIDQSVLYLMFYPRIIQELRTRFREMVFCGDGTRGTVDTFRFRNNFPVLVPVPLRKFRLPASLESSLNSEGRGRGASSSGRFTGGDTASLSFALRW